MIERYSRPQMAALWSDQTRFELWLEIEILALEGMAQEGLVPKDIPAEVRSKAQVNAARVLEIEASVKHDVIAFLTTVAESVGPSARFMHRGMTSNDMLDTAFGVSLVRSGKLIDKALAQLMETVKEKAFQYKDLPCVGRSHGMHAEPITFGLKFASWYAELKRQKVRLEGAIKSISVGKLSGAVGTYASLSPAIEHYVLSRLGLEPETVATQVVARDRHADFFAALAQLGASIERFATEIRHLQRTEVGEVEEPFGKDQKGSSAMPHKKNPILCENLVGLGRLLRGYLISSLENVALWHERDISHSSVERVIAPDACMVADFMLHRFNHVIAGLSVQVERIKENLELSNGMIFSGSLLIALADAGVSREDAYRMVQKHALEVRRIGPGLEERVKADPEISKRLGAEKLNHVFDLKRHLSHVDIIFGRTFNS